MNQIYDKNSIYETKFSLSELYSFEGLKKLLKIIPEIATLYNPINKLKYEESEKINISYFQAKISKFPFFKIILSKLKSYFEVNESFVIIKSLTILMNEIDNLDKYFASNSHPIYSKNKNKNEQKSGSKNSKENKSFKKNEKLKKNNYKNIETSRISEAPKNINDSYNVLNNISNILNVKENNKKTVYFRVLDNQIKKESKTDLNSFHSKLSSSNKQSQIYLNETERKISNTNLSLSNLKKYEYQKMFGKKKQTSQIGLKIYLDSNNNSNSRSQNYSTNFDTTNDNNSNQKSKFKNYIKNAENDLFNNNNNLYINFYGQKKNKKNLTEVPSLNIPSLKNQTKISGVINEKKENKEYKENKENNENKENIIINYNYLNISLLNDIESKDFNIFDLDRKSSKNTLILISSYIFNRFGFHNIMKYSMFENWCRKIGEGYSRKNPYHTDLHASDTTQACLIFFKIGKINEICKLKLLSKCALFLSCICHDYKHPGVNNNFLRDTKNILAIKYNDNSILENMHISEAFKLTIDYSNCNIFYGMNSDNYKQIRKEMISCVLYTCMTKHDINKNFMKELINNKKNINNNIINKDNIKNEEKDIHENYMNLLIHSADISNPTRKFDIYWKWAELVVEEFLIQGDKEKEFGIKCSFDRETMTVYQNQLGFIEYIVLPHYILFIDLFPKLKYLLDNINDNKNKILEFQQKNKKIESKDNNKIKK